MSDQWYYNTETHEVSQGVKDSWTNRMGPYDSREEAEHALSIAKQRNEEAAAYDDEED